MGAYDVAIAGGGLIGAAAALELAKHGLSICLIDRQTAGNEASWAAAGMLSAAPESPESLPLLPLSRASAELYPSFAAEVENGMGGNVGYRKCGAIEAFFGDCAEQGCKERIAAIRGAGIRAEAIAPEEARRMEPALSEAIGAACILPEEAVVSPRELMAGILVACKNRRVDIVENCAVSGVREENGAVAGMETERGVIATKIAVIATGCFSHMTPALERWGPTTPVRGQMMALRHPGQPIGRILRSEEGYVVPRSPGRVVAGSTLERAGFVKEVTSEGLRQILDAATKLANGLASAQVVDTWAGLRPDTPDHLPVIGTTEIQGLIFATGHYRNGILLAPITARLVSELIVENKTSLDIAAFSPLRFSAAGDTGTPQSHPASGI